MHQPFGELPQLRFEIIEAARILRMSRATLYERIKAGEIKAQKDWPPAVHHCRRAAAVRPGERIVPNREIALCYAWPQMTKPGKSVRPRCLVVAGPNGAGKTTFAREYLPHDVRVLNFVNADLIAGGLSPLKPELAAIAAARLVLKEIARLVEERADFAFESTLSGLSYISRLRDMKQSGYHIEIIYLKIVSPRLAINRIKSRVQEGGHDVPRADVRREL